MLINHHSVSLACCNAVIPEFVEANKRIAARLTRRKSRTSPENWPTMRFVDDFNRFIDYPKKIFDLKHLPSEKPSSRA
jgi:hypothetical protein